MKPDRSSYSKLFAYGLDCERPIGGSCVGNCRIVSQNLDCMRPIGGNCTGNCRIADTHAAGLVW
ncbi:MAG: hypothetical protein IJR85_07630 [Synergistaceae bacterium]|nr:hypothetical protein [Synergistaceae bacterium]